MGTNQKEELDTAMIRLGNADLNAELGLVDKKTAGDCLIVSY